MSVCVLCGPPVWPSPPVVGPLRGPLLCVGPLWAGSPLLLCPRFPWHLFLVLPLAHALALYVPASRHAAGAAAPKLGGRHAARCPSASAAPNLAFTRYCYYHYCMVYGIQTRGRRGGRILPNSRAIVLHQGGQCRWGGAIKR